VLLDHIVKRGGHINQKHRVLVELLYTYV